MPVRGDLSEIPLYYDRNASSSPLNVTFLDAFEILASSRGDLDPDRFN